MVRKLEKIEKEMSYCEIKLEKERRLRKQAEFLTAELEAVDRFLILHESSDLRLHELPFPRIAQQISMERSRSEEPGPAFHRAVDGFTSAGVFQMVREDRAVLEQERDELRSKLESFSGFVNKRSVLEEERRDALSSMSPAHSAKVRKLNEESKKIENQWNSLNEDALNLEEALFYLARNVDYVKSARAFLITAKGNFDVENWADSSYSTDLFRHSNIARAKEMLDGACRNQKLAQKELCCLVHLRVELEGFEPILVKTLAGLFSDIFVEGRLHRSLDLIEEALAKSGSFLQQVRKKQEVLHGKLERVEKTRDQLFQRMGGERRGRVSTG